ncbi:MAG TPA: DNA polymerase III subunit alpha [Gemmataceae bacterium]|nr:DNA polymerase III subunit alpha [Gemmataceae bacterium]
MADRPFVHLHCHTHYSLLDGASRIPELVAHVKKLGMNAVAITDHGNLYGAIEFYRECKAAGLNPILGYEAYVAPNKRTDREQRRASAESDDAIYHHLTLLAYNAAGFRNLIKMSSLAFLEGYHYKPRIDKELLETHKEGLICLSGCAAAEFSDHILKDRLEDAVKTAQWFHQLFGKHFYVEIQNNGLQIQKQCEEGAIDVANKLGLPLVATSDAHYLKQEDHVAHDVLLCINTGRLRSNPKRFKFEGNQFHIRGPEEMYKLFPGREDAVRRSQEIADACHIDLDFKKRHFPVFTPPPGKKPDDYLRELCEQGLLERYRGKPPEKEKAARARLEHELGIVCRMGFASYFLIVWDFVRFALEHGIPASARGSACGAMVSYVLKLSHVDPLEYDLLFERFLDPNRSEAPDIDIDFCQDRREEVIAYVKQKYGEASVAQIATFGTLAAKAALKDVGRVLDVPLARVTQLTNWVPETLGISLADALQQSPEFREAYNTDPQVRELVDIAKTLEGTNRNTGIHAAGVVIANGPLIDYVPVHRAVRKGEDAASRGGDVVVATQWVMGDLEKVGLLKMDFLGLRTLTVLDNAVKLIETTRGQKIDLFNLPLDDPETYALLQRGDAKGVFQLEKDGIRELIKRMKPDNFRDIIATIALYRPGPLQGGMVDAYVNRKHGREKPTYPHPALEEILGKTFGIMVYQEDVMRILNRLGGIELSSAYACIKAISKKKHDIIEQRRAEFLKGAMERGVREDTARDIFDLITFFGGYGFNASHSAAYALVAYQTAYLKTHYTQEFMAALLSSELDKRKILVEHLEDAKRLGYPVQPPNVNRCDPDFTVRGDDILFGLVAIKGLGRGAAEEIVRQREAKGPYKDIFDFCERVDLKIVSKAATERLIKAGAFDCFGAQRAQLMAALPRAMQAANELQADRKHGQMNLFEVLDADGPGDAPVAATLPEVPEWPPSEKLKYEKEALDFYISSHPLAQHEDVLRLFSTHESGQLRDLQAQQEVLMGGMLTQVRLMNTKKARNGNSRYARFKLEDFSGQAECVMWPDDYVNYKELVEEDRICFIGGIVEKTREEPGLVVSRVLTIEQAQRERTTGLAIALRLGEHTPGHLDQVARVLQAARGSCPVFLYVRDGTGKQVVLKAGEGFRINPIKLPKAELDAILGPGCVHFSRQGNGAARNGK